MSVSKPLKLILLLLVALLPAAYLLYVYPDLPAQVPTHFNWKGDPDDYSQKSSLFYFVALLLGLAIGMYFLLTNLPRIDPKKTAMLSMGVFNKLAVAMLLFLTALSIIIIHSSVQGRFTMNKLMAPMLGLLFVYIGNLMHSMRPNYFVGIRLPWTLEDPDNWKATHQLASKIWVAGGLLITVLCLLLPDNVAMIFFIACLLAMVLIPIIFSYRYFVQHKNPQ